jgi:low temperature requirement protein LtrA
MSDLEPLVAEETLEEEERKTSYLELFFDSSSCLRSRR